jgi:hypothetical protein
MFSRTLIAFVLAASLLGGGLRSLAFGQRPDVPAAACRRPADPTSALRHKTIQDRPISLDDEVPKSQSATDSPKNVPQVVVELRVVSVPEDFSEPMGLEFGPTAQARTRTDELQKVVFLDERQVAQFMEAAQGNAKTEVMQAPRLTLFDGEASTIEVGEAQSFVTGVDVRWKGRGMMVVPHQETIRLGCRSI